jgi:hypothetical protein
MATIYSLFLAAVLITSCGPTISYNGNNYQPTGSVDVFVDEGTIPKEYTVVGKGYVHFYGSKVPESIQNKAIAKAKSKGADAILVKDYYAPLSSEGIAEALQKNNSTKKRQPLTPTNQSAEIVILFLKYK